MLSEEDIHKQISEYLAWVLPEYVVWTTVENSNQQGGRAGLIKQAKLKAKGVKKGWPDIQIFWPYFGKTKGLCLEVKVPGKDPTDSQIDCHNALDSVFIPTEVVYSSDDVKLAFKKHNVPTKRGVNGRDY